MLKAILPQTTQVYGVYYVVFGSLAGGEHLFKEYLWDSIVYTDLKDAVEQAQKLRVTHQNDPSFVVKRYRNKDCSDTHKLIDK